MNFSFNGFIYQVLIDPILARLHNTILDNIDPSHRVIDVACGTGSLSLAIAGKAKSVTGIDLSEEMIGTASRSAKRRGITNVIFELRDASHLTEFKKDEFDVAVTTMAIHQFDAELAVKILSEMKRIASKVVIVDYNHPMPKGFSRSLAYGIERIAGGDHYRNFAVYMKKEGISYFTKRSGLLINSQHVRGNGVFLVSVCE
jgi:ubiquinone/menaquinone biosynthesis C-methylase UbiE